MNKPLPQPIAPQRAETQPRPLRSQDTFDSLLSEEERPPSPVKPSITEITNLDDEIEQELSELKKAD